MIAASLARNIAVVAHEIAVMAHEIVVKEVTDTRHCDFVPLE